MVMVMTDQVLKLYKLILFFNVTRLFILRQLAHLSFRILFEKLVPTVGEC